MQKKYKKEDWKYIFFKLNEEVIIKRFEQIILLILIIFCLSTIALRKRDRTDNNEYMIYQQQNIKEENNIYALEKISNDDIVQSNLMPEKIGEECQEDSTSKRVIQNQKLKEINPDFVGWLSIPNTSIDYPVMFKKNDNDYYLCHDFEQKESKAGLLVLDKRCSIKQDELNILIHGHHMKSGAMFGILEQYKNEMYFFEHPKIQYSTVEEEIEYEIFAVFISSLMAEDMKLFDYYNYININTESEFNDYIEGIKSNSLYESNIYPEYGDRLITLSTCDYSVDEGRLVVVGRAVRIVKGT